MPIENIILMGGTLAAFALLAFMMYRSIKKYESKPKGKRKKGRYKYMPKSKYNGK